MDGCNFVLVLLKYYYDLPELRSTFCGGLVVNLLYWHVQKYDGAVVVRKSTHPTCVHVRFTIHFAMYGRYLHD